MDYKQVKFILVEFNKIVLTLFVFGLILKTIDITALFDDKTMFISIVSSLTTGSIMILQHRFTKIDPQQRGNANNE